MKEIIWLIAGIVIGFLLHLSLCNKINIVDEKVTSTDTTISSNIDTVYVKQVVVDTLIKLDTVYKNRYVTKYVREAFPVVTSDDTSSTYDYTSLHTHIDLQDTIQVKDSIGIINNKIVLHDQKVYFPENFRLVREEIRSVDTVFINRVDSIKIDTEIKQRMKFNVAIGSSFNQDFVAPTLQLRLNKNNLQGSYRVNKKQFTITYLRDLW